MKSYKLAQTIPLIGLQDGRRKLTDKERQEIILLRNEKELSYIAIASQYKVSRSLVRIICNPETAKKQRERNVTNWRKYYERYGKEYHAASMRKTRNKKYKMYKNKELIKE